jgi:hypothetical protein
VVKITKAHIDVGKMILASPLTIWDLITDTSQWIIWGLTVKVVRNCERYIRKDSQGQVLTAVGTWRRAYARSSRNSQKKNNR